LIFFPSLQKTENMARELRADPAFCPQASSADDRPQSSAKVTLFLVTSWQWSQDGTVTLDNEL